MITLASRFIKKITAWAAVQPQNLPSFARSTVSISIRVATLVLSGTLFMLPLTSAIAAPPAKTVGKVDVIARLKSIQDRQNIELQSVDDAIQKRFLESTQVSLKNQDASLNDRKIVRLVGQIDDLAVRRNEYIARRQMLNDLIFAIDTKWAAQPLNVFLEHQFLDMALSDVNDPKSDLHTWKFLVYMSIAIREVPEPREDVINVIESYINFSGVLEPKSPALFLASRNYMNGSLSYSAKPVARDKVGDLVEAQLKQMREAQKSAGNNATNLGRKTKLTPADIELRIAPIAPPVTSTSTSTSTSASPSGGGRPVDDQGTISGSTSSGAAAANQKTETNHLQKNPQNNSQGTMLIPAMKTTDGISNPPPPPDAANQNH